MFTQGTFTNKTNEINDMHHLTTGTFSDDFINIQNNQNEMINGLQTMGSSSAVGQFYQVNGETLPNPEADGSIESGIDKTTSKNNNLIYMSDTSNIQPSSLNNNSLTQQNDQKSTEIIDKLSDFIYTVQVDSSKIIYPNGHNKKNSNNNIDEEDSLNHMDEEEEEKDDDLIPYKKGFDAVRRENVKEFYKYTIESLQRQSWKPDINLLFSQLSDASFLYLKIFYSEHKYPTFIQGKKFLISRDTYQLQDSQRNTEPSDAIIIGNASCIFCEEGKYIIPNDVIIGKNNSENVFGHAGFFEISKLYNSGNCSFRSGSKKDLTILRCDTGKRELLKGPKPETIYYRGDKIEISGFQICIEF